MYVDHDDGFDPSAAVAEVGDYLMDLITWAWFATITFPFINKRPAAIARLREYLDSLKCAAQGAIGWAFVVEKSANSGCLHSHLLVAGVEELSRKEWWAKAFTQFGRSEIRQFDAEQGGAYYLAQNAVKGSGYIYLGGGLVTSLKTYIPTTIAGVAVRKLSDTD